MLVVFVVVVGQLPDKLYIDRELVVRMVAVAVFEHGAIELDAFDRKTVWREDDASFGLGVCDHAIPVAVVAMRRSLFAAVDAAEIWFWLGHD